ncbi:MAG: hypothetical protein ACRDBP_19470 [Luteolibacter sp.]
MKDSPTDHPGWHPALATLLVLVAGVVAHVTCFGAIFFLDDWHQVVESQNVTDGLWLEQKWRALPYLTYWLNYKFFGFSEAAFHATNLAVHLLTALAVLFCADAFLRQGSATPEVEKSGRRPSGFAITAALIFAVHPLTVEVTHYTRARDHGLVGLFAFLAAYGALRFFKGSFLWILFLVPVTALAAISKEPGLPHALLAIFLVAVMSTRKEDWRRLVTNRFVLVTAVVLAVVVAVFHSDLISPLVRTLLGQTDDSRFGWHLLTQARVFWAYLQLMIFPAPLCADHLITWTRSTGDTAAWVGAAGIVISMAGILVVWRKGHRAPALFLAMLSGHLLLRNLYVVSELMVEYRTYPSMPWFAMLVALVLSLLIARRRLYVGCAVVLISTLTFLSIRRGKDWQTVDRLVASTLKVYPLQLRAMSELNRRDLDGKNWQAVLDRQPEFQRLFASVMESNKNNPLRYYENWSLWVVGNECQVSEALLYQKGPLAARVALHATAARMRANGIEHGLLWGLWSYQYGLAFLASGDTEKAFAYFQMIRGPGSPIPDSRIAEKLDEYGIDRALLDPKNKPHLSAEMISEMEAVGLPKDLILKQR